jgi:hypothetical protein
MPVGRQTDFLAGTGNITHRDLKPEKVIVTTSPGSLGGGIPQVRT